MAGNLVHINLLGTRFSIETDEKPEYLQNLIESLDKRLSSIEKATGLRDPLKLSLLVGILLEDEVKKIGNISKKNTEKGDLSPEESYEAEQLTLNILKNIDKTLLD